jgi:hypothetical protein
MVFSVILLSSGFWLGKYDSFLFYALEILALGSLHY